jgi:predicted protein tyrosine phosphatase
MHTYQEWIKHRARDSNLLAHRYKFLWGAYRPKYYWFEVFDMFRRFAVIGLPKLLRVIAPNTNFQVYIGLLVMAVAPATYTAMDPYQAVADHRLMLSTQLAEVVVVLCAMLLADMKGTTADIACTVIIMVTLLPMLIVLVLYVCDPSGSLLIKLSRRVPFIRAANEAVEDALQFVRELTKEHPEVAEALEFTMSGVDENQDAASIVEIAAELGQSMLVLDTAAMRAHLAELLSALGLPKDDIEEIMEVLSASKLLAWCLRPKLEPYFAEKGLEWADVVPVLETIDSVEELRAAADDPEAFLEGVLRSSGPAAKKLAIMHLKPRLDPYLRARGLEWADVVPVLETIDSVEELRAAADDPEAFVDRVSRAGGPAAKTLAIMHLKPRLDPYLRARGLEWTDMVLVLETIDSVEELRAAVNDPEAFVDRVISEIARIWRVNSRASGPAAKKLAILRLKPRLDPYLRARGLEWADVVLVLETIDSIGKLHAAAAADPEVLLEQIFALKQTKQTAEDFAPPEAKELERQGQDLDQPCGAEIQFATEAQPLSINQLTACLEWAPGCVDQDMNPTHPTKAHSPARPVDRRANVLSEPVEPTLPAHSMR